jgi:hypothetical protein
MAKQPQQPQPSPPSPPQSQQQQLRIRYVDLPDLREAFGDSIQSMIWDGHTLRVEFSVTRYQPSAGGQTEAVRYPICRLGLSVAAANDLAARLQQTMNAVRTAATAQTGRQDTLAADAPEDKSK